MTQTAAPAPDPTREQALRRRLGVPTGAPRTLILAESSHWDPNWLKTSDEYLRRYVLRNLDLALDELQREPRRVYSVECLFFLRLYWEQRPKRQGTIRELVNSGRLRLTSSGVTTADTLLPQPEAILRDWLLGQEWLRAHGMTPEPRLAYFTDSFGCAPALPALLRAAGFDYTALTRIDGMYFLLGDYEPAFHFPRPGSSAELLQKELRTTDFVWRAPDGSEVLAHWNAFNYAQGDMLAHRGLSRVYLFPLAWPDRAPRHVARRIAQYVAQLAPLARTPYLFCPIGFDFVPPIPDLLALLDRYNRTEYPRTGVYVVNAGLDDYMALMECHRNRLPVLALDPNPYWTGFYTARPALKEACHALVDELRLTEMLAVRAGQGERMARELAGPWWVAATANHHDWITGTSPDRVYRLEQRPWLERARLGSDEFTRSLLPHLERSAPKTAGEERTSKLVTTWTKAGVLQVQTPHYVLEFAEEAGGTIVRAWHPATGGKLLDGPSNDLLSYRDSGGLWRMGCEFRGGTWRLWQRTSSRRAKIEVRELAGGLEIVCEGELAGLPVRRRLWCHAGTPVILGRFEGRAADGHTLLLGFETGLHAERLHMDLPGGVVERPPHKVYTPTFWPLQRFLHLQDVATGRGLALGLRRPGAVTYDPASGRLEVIALRNANHELAWGLVPFPGNPAVGHERDACACEYALLFTEAGGWQENGLPGALQIENPWQDPQQTTLRRLAGELVTTDRPDVDVVAVKPAARGEGVVVRLYTLAVPPGEVTLTWQGGAVKSAMLCDARERDLQPLAVEKNTVRFAMPGALASVRLMG